MNEVTYLTLSNPGIIHTVLTDEQLKPIHDEIKKIQQDFSQADSRNKQLAGNIQHEYGLYDCREHVENLTTNLAYTYNSHCDMAKGYLSDQGIRDKNYRFKLGGIWVNFQKKYEFNPIHNHSGVLSFVLWINVPYDINDEIAHPSSVNSNSLCPGHFSFIFINNLGKIGQQNIPVDRTFNGKMVMFPSGLNHCVYPFYTSDEYRISVSGNIYIEVTD